MDNVCKKCGSRLYRDGYQSIEITEGCTIEIKGECYCHRCGKRYKYHDFIDTSIIDYDTEISEMED